MAVVAGLASDGAKDAAPEARSTYPVGELVCAALETGVPEIILAVGGSATIDGGLGLLQAMGARFTVSGRPLHRMFTGGDLEHLDQCDLSHAEARLGRTRLVVATDVRNPLTGPNGSAHVYGPQKGLTPQTIPAFEAGFGRLEDLLGQKGDEAGDGAAGGVGYGLRAGLGARLAPGAALIAELTGLPEACSRASYLVTGEGCYDDQTAWGKVAWEVGQLAGRLDIRCGMVAGRIQRSQKAMESDPFSSHISLCDSGWTQDPGRVGAGSRGWCDVARTMVGL